MAALQYLLKRIQTVNQLCIISLFGLLSFPGMFIPYSMWTLHFGRDKAIVDCLKNVIPFFVFLQSGKNAFTLVGIVPMIVCLRCCCLENEVCIATELYLQ